MSDNTTMPARAAINPSILKPGTNRDESHRVNEFTIMAKIPSVKKLIGAVINNRMGRINAFISPITIAASSALAMWVISKPGTK